MRTVRTGLRRQASVRERRAKLLYIRSQYDHYSMITNKKVIPLLLRLTRLEKL